MTTRPRNSDPAPRYSVEDALNLLEQAPGRIAGATTERSAEELIEPLEPDGWSARDILGHIRACHATWGSYIERILDEDHPSFRAESPRTTIDRTDFLEQPFGPSLAAFTRDREHLMARLRAADPADLARTAAVNLPGFGIQYRSVRYYADRLADHENQHVRHIERVVGR